MNATYRPSASSPIVSAIMKRVKSKNTKPELAIRRLLFAAGFRYRIHYKPIEAEIGRASIDIAFTGMKLAVFIDGCFWHSCPKHGSIPKANREWWRNKLEGNYMRDKRITEILSLSGWTVFRFWSHETPESMFSAIEQTIRYHKNNRTHHNSSKNQEYL